MSPIGDAMLFLFRFIIEILKRFLHLEVGYSKFFYKMDKISSNL